MMQPNLVKFAIVFARNVQDQIAMSALLANQDIFCKGLPVWPAISLVQFVQVLSTHNVPHATQIIIFSHHLQTQHVLALVRTDTGLTMKATNANLAMLFALFVQVRVTQSVLFAIRDFFCSHHQQLALTPVQMDFGSIAQVMFARTVISPVQFVQVQTTHNVPPANLVIFCNPP